MLTIVNIESIDTLINKGKLCVEKTTPKQKTLRAKNPVPNNKTVNSLSIISPPTF